MPKLFLLVSLNARNSNRGATLIEILIVVIIVGILAAIAIPSLMGLLISNNVKNGLDQVQLSLRDAQRQAIRLSQSCTVDFTKDAAGTLTKIGTATVGCLSSSNSSLPTGVMMQYQTSLADKTLTDNAMSVSFSFKGNTTLKNSDASQTIVISASDGKGQKRCLFISSPLGIMRTGTYDTTAQSCNASL